MDTDCGDALTTEEERREFLYAPSVPGGGGGSGGYLDYTFRRAALVLFGVAVEGPLPFTTPRAKNPDLGEVTLEVGGKTVLRFAAAYGFRNIQNVVRKCKAGRARRRRRGRVRFRGDHGVPFGVPERRRAARPPHLFEPGFRLSERIRALTDDAGGTTAKALVDELEELYHTGGVRARGIGVGVGAASRVAGNRVPIATWRRCRRGPPYCRGRRWQAPKANVALDFTTTGHRGGHVRGGDGRGGGEPQDHQRLVAPTVKGFS